MKQVYLFSIIAVLVFSRCRKDDVQVQEDPSSFTEVGSVTIGGTGATEITAYDPTTKKLFVVSNTGGATRIDVIDLSNPATPSIYREL